MYKSFSGKLLFFIITCLFLAKQETAQIAYHNFNGNNGLPSNEVYSVYQDKDGFLWFATDHGVVKYNGYNFKTYTTSDGLTDNTALEIKSDEEDQIWVLTLSGGLCYYDGKKFVPHPQNDLIKKVFNIHLPTSWIPLKNKQIWFGIVNLGVVKVDSNEIKVFSVKDADKLSGAKDTVRIYVLQMYNGKYVYTSYEGRKIPEVKDPAVKSFSAYDVDKIYTGVNFNLLVLGNKKILMSLERFLLYIDSNTSYQFECPRNNIVLKLKLSDDGKIWMMQKNSGAFTISIGKENIDKTDSITFSSNITDLLTDRQGNQWVTSLDHGIYIAPNQNVKIFTSADVLRSTKLSCINSNSNAIYVGLPEGKILKIDKHFNSTVRYAGTGTKWPSAISSITFRINGNPQPSLDTELNWDHGRNLYHTKILQIDKQSFLLGSATGLSLLTRNAGIKYSINILGIPSKVTEICKLSENKYLIGTLAGLYHFSSQKLTAKEEPYFKNVRITAAKLLNPKIYGVTTRGKGVIININNNLYDITETQGIISNLTEDLYFENDSTLWIATFKGISKIYFKLAGKSIITRVKNYTREDGLCSNQVTGITGFNGRIWLATNEGLCYFLPSDLPEKKTLIPLYFDNMLVNGIKWSFDSLVLNHDQNNIFIEFNGLYYKAIDGIRYRVRLKDRSSWKYTDLNYIQYFTLPPGEYQLEVAADDKDGKYISRIRTLKFVIKPRFTETVTFKILLALSILLIISLIVSSIFSYQKLKATNVIKLLQSEFKALSYQINPHFIFNVLNSIQYYILKKDTDNAVHLLGSFSLLIRRIVNNSRQQYIGIIEEVECLKEYMDLEKMRLDNKFEYTINIDSSIDIEDRNILPMIIQPLVENSIWHGIVPSAKPGVISIDFKKENGTVVCNVEDNGVGINTAVMKEKNQNNLSLAMKNVSERLKIISELNDTTWAIRTEDKSVTNPSQSGTIVTIIFPAIKDKK